MVLGLGRFVVWWFVLVVVCLVVVVLGSVGLFGLWFGILGWFGSSGLRGLLFY